MRVRVDTSDKSQPPLRAGMSAEVDVDTGHARGLPHFLTAVRPSTARRDVRRRAPGSPKAQSRGDHRLRHSRDADAGAGHDHRQRRAALHAGQRLGEPGPDRLGADVLHRRRRDHDAADGISCRTLRAQAAVSWSRWPASPSRRCCAAWRSRWTQIVLFRVLQGAFGAALVPLSQTVLLNIYPQGAPGLRHGAVGRRA